MWNPFKRNKQKKMVAELQILREELQKFKYYQWTKTERLGMVTEFKDIVSEGEMIFIEFADGSRINAELLDEFLIKTNIESELLEITDTVPQPILPEAAGSAKVRISDKHQDTPLHALLKKQKPNLVNVDISIELNIPGPELYKVICSSFDGAEEEVAEWVVQGINMETIKNIIKEGLKKYYE
jgi:hypothetical protein